MWIYKGADLGLEPPPGAPVRDMEDDDFEAACKEYDKGFSPEQAGSLKTSPFYQHVSGGKRVAAVKEADDGGVLSS